MSLQWAAARLHTHRCVRGGFTVGRSLDYTSAMLPGLRSPQTDSLLRDSVDVAAFRGSFLTFPLEKRHDGFHTLDVSSAHWHRPVSSRVPSFKCICSLHSWRENGLLSQPRWVLSNYNFAKSKPSTAAILSINVLLPGWCGSSIVGNYVLPTLARRGRCFNARETQPYLNN